MELSLLISSVVHRYDIEPLEPGKKVSALLSSGDSSSADPQHLPIAGDRGRILAEAVGVQRRYEAQISLDGQRRFGRREGCGVVSCIICVNESSALWFYGDSVTIRSFRIPTVSHVFALTLLSVPFTGRRACLLHCLNCSLIPVSQPSAHSESVSPVSKVVRRVLWCN